MGSQFNQDILADKFLNQKSYGTFVDIGCSFYESMNNTFYLEKHRNYKGIALDLNPDYAAEWQANRANSIFVHADATSIDYQQLFNECNLPKNIDFLSIDVDPKHQSLKALYKVFETDRHFSVITFEVDAGSDNGSDSIKNPSRAFLASKGYVFIKEIYQGNYHVDDFWVHKSIYDCKND